MCLKYMFTNYKILTRVAFRIVLFLLFIEIFLRFDGWISLVLQENRNKSNLKGLNTYSFWITGLQNKSFGNENNEPLNRILIPKGKVSPFEDSEVGVVVMVIRSRIDLLSFEENLNRFCGGKSGAEHGG